jgi:hypothetical protein
MMNSTGDAETERAAEVAGRVCRSRSQWTACNDCRRVSAAPSTENPNNIRGHPAPAPGRLRFRLRTLELRSHSLDIAASCNARNIEWKNWFFFRSAQLGRVQSALSPTHRYYLHVWATRLPRTEVVHHVSFCSSSICCENAQFTSCYDCPQLPLLHLAMAGRQFASVTCQRPARGYRDLLSPCVPKSLRG